jgi:response regulator RpfG family c-di-GMP phosphodiesterase
VRVVESREAHAAVALWRPGLVILGSTTALFRRAGSPRVLFLSSAVPGHTPLVDGDAYVQTPFHPRELAEVVRDMMRGLPVSPVPSNGSADLLERYAVDLATVTVEERAARASLEDAYLHTVQTLAAAAEARDATTGAHLQRVRLLGCTLAEAMAPWLLEDRSLEYGFLLHDVGKIGVPDAVLRKPGALTPQETDLMRSHVLLGEQFLERVPYLAEARRIVACHHERWDGQGYPRGLRGLEIPLGARIFAVADAFDAMTSDRPYRPAMRVDEARDEIARHVGEQFDPEVVEAFLSLSERVLHIALHG